jgi:hypothetical protein
VINYARKVGRLLEIRVSGEHKTNQFGRQIALAKEVGPEAKLVVCADWREADVQSQSREFIEQLTTIFRINAPRTEAGVCLVGNEHHVRVIGRIKQDVPQINVSVARTVDEALAVLKPRLNAAELARAKQFLDEK